MATTPITRKQGETFYNPNTGRAEGTVQFDSNTGARLTPGQATVDAVAPALPTTPTSVSTPIAVDSLNTPVAPVAVAPVAVSTKIPGMLAGIKSTTLQNVAQVAQDEANLAKTAADKDQQDITKIFSDLAGLQGEKNDLYKDTGVNDLSTKLKRLNTEISSDDLNRITQIEEIKKRSGGLTAGTQAEIQRVDNESLTNRAKKAIEYNALSGSYAEMKTLADDTIKAKSDQLNLDLKSKTYFLEQNLDRFNKNEQRVFDAVLKDEERTINNVQKQSEDAVANITKLIEDGKITPEFGSQSISQILDGKPLSQVYANIGIVGSSNPGIVAGYDISKYATDPNHEIAVKTIYNSLPDVTDAKSAEEAIKSRAINSPITGQMIMNASIDNNVDPKIIIAMMAQDSSLGTKGLGAKNNNPGNIGQFDSLGTKGVAGYKTLDEGVNAVGKWLKNHKATGVYNGEFGATIDQATDFEPAKTQESYQLSLQNLIASGDYKSAYKKMENSVSKSLTGENKTSFDAKVTGLPALDDLQAKLNAFETAGGNTGILKGNIESIYNKLGTVKDPALTSLAADLKISLQQYRQKMSGAAFSEQEARDYASVNPTATNNLELNTALINGLRDNMQRSVDSTVEGKLGEGAKYIKDFIPYQGLTPTQSVDAFGDANPQYRQMILDLQNAGATDDIIATKLAIPVIKR